MSRPRAPRVLLQRAGGRYPRAAVALADLVARLSRSPGRGVTAATFAHYFPEHDERALRRLAQESWTGWLRHRVLQAACASPTATWPYPPQRTSVPADELHGPLVLAGFHVGPISGVGALLERLPADVLVLQLTPSRRPGLRTAVVGADRWSRAAATRQAIDVLRAGGIVYLMADANRAPSTIETTILGRRCRLARGPFALARLTGAPLRPVAARWAGRTIDIVVGDPIQARDEAGMALDAGRWFSAFLRASPEVVGPPFARSFLGDD